MASSLAKEQGGPTNPVPAATTSNVQSLPPSAEGAQQQDPAVVLRRPFSRSNTEGSSSRAGSLRSKRFSMEKRKSLKVKREKAMEELLETERNFLKDMSDIHHGYEEAIPTSVSNASDWAAWALGVNTESLDLLFLCFWSQRPSISSFQPFHTFLLSLSLSLSIDLFLDLLCTLLQAFCHLIILPSPYMTISLFFFSGFNLGGKVPHLPQSQRPYMPAHYTLILPWARLYPRQSR